MTSILKAASSNKVTLVVGVIERCDGPITGLDPKEYGSSDKGGDGTLYCTSLTIDETGKLLSSHRKLMPTGTERLVWGQGDGAGVSVVQTVSQDKLELCEMFSTFSSDNLNLPRLFPFPIPFLSFLQASGKVGSVICWEVSVFSLTLPPPSFLSNLFFTLLNSEDLSHPNKNYMPLHRAAVYSQGVEVYTAPTADCRDTWTSSMRHIASEGRCFVVSCCQFNKVEDYPEDYPPHKGESLSCRRNYLKNFVSVCHT